MHSRPSKGQGGRPHKTIGVAEITAGQGNSVSDDMMEGRARAGRKVRKGWKRVDGKCQDKVEGEDEWCVRERRAGQGRVG